MDCIGLVIFYFSLYRPSTVYTVKYNNLVQILHIYQVIALTRDIMPWFLSFSKLNLRIYVTWPRPDQELSPSKVGIYLTGFLYVILGLVLLELVQDCGYAKWGAHCSFWHTVRAKIDHPRSISYFDFALWLIHEGDLFKRVVYIASKFETAFFSIKYIYKHHGLYKKITQP